MSECAENPGRRVIHLFAIAAHVRDPIAGVPLVGCTYSQTDACGPRRALLAKLLVVILRVLNAQAATLHEIDGPGLFDGHPLGHVIG